jgi:hypothetical protein
MCQFLLQEGADCDTNPMLVNLIFLTFALLYSIFVPPISTNIDPLNHSDDADPVESLSSGFGNMSTVMIGQSTVVGLDMLPGRINAGSTFYAFLSVPVMTLRKHWRKGELD